MGLSDFLVKAFNKSVEIIESIGNDNVGTCEKGDCLINNDTLFITCSETDCPRMKAAQVVSHDEIVDPCLWAYMKRLEKIQNEMDLDKCADFVYDLVKEYMTKYIPFLDIIGLNFVFNGIACDNSLFCLLWELKNEDISWTRHQFEMLVAGVIGSVELHLQYDFYRNPSLYNRDDFDFDYIVKIFETVMDEEKLTQYYDPESININDLYNANGNIKPAGIGGHEAGFYGDTIWNTIESWDKI